MGLRASSVLVVLLCVSASSCQREEGGKQATSTTGKDSNESAVAAPGAAKLELFVMSQCPYGVQVVNAAAEAKKTLGSALDLQIQFIGDGAPGNFNSLHGPNEVKGDLVQVCAFKHAPTRALGMITCQNKDPKQVAENWRDCAKQAGMDVAELDKCANGDEGQKLLAASFAEAKKRGASGSPTMFMAGQPYEGGRKPRDFVRAACGASKGSKPEACAKIPVPPKVSAVFLSDKRCDQCDITRLEPRLRSELGGLVVEHVDYGTDEGKALYKELAAADSSFKFLPAVLLGPEVAQDKDGYQTLEHYLHPVGNYMELRLGGQWDPTAEICGNDTDDDGNGKADCQDDGCKNFLGCRPTKAKKLDLFVMSQCPYGAKAMIAAKEFSDHFKGNVALDVHFIGNVQGDQLSSLHGPAEVDEDVRERCAIEHYSKDNQFLRYLSCRSRDYKNPEWKPCAQEAGIDADVIQKCFDGDGKKLVTESFAFAESLNIGASPTFVVNNKRDFNAITASQIQQEYCKDNPSLAACKDTIAEPAMPAGAAAQQPAGQCN
ncbi:MAG TPA: DsbA family protein [Kofleriaceae bacterium]|nr:DsbA family protein [Kofleriaceae bacterium]